MTDLIQGLNLSVVQWALIALSGLLIGMSKVGVPGVSQVVIPLLAMSFGGKQSTGVLLPILMMADVFAVAYYRRHAEWKYLVQILPWAFAGLLIALWIGNLVNDEQFKSLIAILVFLSVGLMLWKDARKGEQLIPKGWWFAAFMGMLGGFATMIGNVAGPVFAIYLLSMRLPKNSFIGTSAWFFLILNFSKFPLQYFVWKNIAPDVLLTDLMALPAIALGALSGIKLVKILPEKVYRTAVIIITVLSAFLLLI